jgi:hypothetical protein
MGLTYWLKIRATEITKLKMLKPLARKWYGRISTVYETIRGVKAILDPANVNWYIWHVINSR